MALVPALQRAEGRAARGGDPETGELMSLYNPRTQPWREHFGWSVDDSLIEGRTPVGRATIAALQLNRPMLVATRRRWVRAGWHPPEAARGERDGDSKVARPSM